MDQTSKKPRKRRVERSGDTGQANGVRVGIIAQDPLRAAVLGRHLVAQGHEVWVDTLTHAMASAAPDCSVALLVADLTSEPTRPGPCLGALRRTYPMADGVVLLRAEQGVTSEEALRSGIRAILREPLRLEELDLHVGLCLERKPRRRAAVLHRQAATGRLAGPLWTTPERKTHHEPNP